MIDPRLGRLHDPELPMGAALHPISDVLPTIRPPRNQSWQNNLILDQGQTSACVGFSAANNLASQPVPESNVSNAVGAEIYHKAQTLDPWKDRPHEGSTITAGIKACQLLFPGIFDSYKWAKTVDEVAAAIGYLGPVIMGTDWRQSMFYPDPATHIIHVDPHSALAGGHAYELWSVNVDTKLFGIKNSWGLGWGLHGKAFISFADLNYLLTSPFGQCLVPLGKHQIPIS